jgi:hypothetical protein
VQYFAQAPEEGLRKPLQNGCLQEKRPVDAIFIVTVVALYAVTHWIVRALSRLGGVE